MPYYYRPTKAIIFTDTELICIAFALGLTVSDITRRIKYLKFTENIKNHI